jgi:uncharacterized lipoprotein YehR (DUF1307 family)
MAKKYTVYFELYGKKMKTEVYAKDSVDAKKVIKDKIIFHKIEADNSNDIKDAFDGFPDSFKNIFGL